MDEDATLIHYKELTAPLRALLYLAGLLTFIAGIQLFILTEHTDRYFAWTIAVPLTSAFLGANYLASFLLSFLSARQTYWARMRIAILPVFTFTTMLLVATILHRDKFHWDSFFGWAWIVVYAVVPPAMIVILIRQLRVRGEAYPRSEPLPGWVRAFLLIQGLFMLVYGVLLFIKPEVGAAYWPWKLTPLTARAVGSWTCGIGMAAFLTPIENDWLRVKPATITYFMVGVLQAVALARYPSDFSWGRVSGMIYLFWVASTIALGLYCVLQIRKYK